MSSILGSISGSAMTASGTSIDSLSNLEGIQVVIQRDGTVVSVNNEDVEPAAKKQRVEEQELDPSQSTKTILFNINKAICLRLDAIEMKFATLTSQIKAIENKLELIHPELIKDTPEPAPPTDSTPPPIVLMPPSSSSNKSSPGRRPNSAVVVGLPQDRIRQISVQEGSPSDNSSQSTSSQSAINSLGPNVTLITLNSEEDYPSGVWLGDENNPEMRVRVPITPSDILHIHSNCRSPEKMALCLLDYLFDRDTQATSNLSGMGKHGKKQLDPLMIYGIRCHLIYRFSISEQDWHRIKQNIDSKCRTAFRRRVRGLPLTVKAFRGKAPPTYVHVINNQPLLSPSALHEIQASEDGLGPGENELHISEEVDLGTGDGQSVLQPEILTNSNGGQIQVVHATPEQVAQLQQTHQIQILHGDQVMHLQSALEDGMQGSLSHPHPSMGNIQVIQSESGETVRIKIDPDHSSGQEDDEMMGLSVSERAHNDTDDDEGV